MAMVRWTSFTRARVWGLSTGSSGTGSTIWEVLGCFKGNARLSVSPQLIPDADYAANLCSRFSSGSSRFLSSQAGFDKSSSIVHKGLDLPPSTRKIGLPKSRVLYTVLRSPHIDKKSREQFCLETKKELLVMKARRNELHKKLFWLKRQRIIGAQCEMLLSCKTRLDKGTLQRLLQSNVSSNNKALAGQQAQPPASRKTAEEEEHEAVIRLRLCYF